jgi:DNA-binding transcriptional MerR regulator
MRHITVMNESATLTLEELSRDVEQELSRRGLIAAQADGRVAAAPDARTVRYYGTLGLVERPRIVDREARYGRRHVLQLVAIKALQARGLPLAEVQKSLYGRSNSQLEMLLNTVTIGRPPQSQALPTVRWKEVTIEPGVKLMVEEHWSPGTSPATLEDRIRAALAALAGNGGPRS